MPPGRGRHLRAGRNGGGVGLARTEFVVAHQVRVHPMALVHPERLPAEDRRRVDELTSGHSDRSSPASWYRPESTRSP